MRVKISKEELGRTISKWLNSQLWPDFIEVDAEPVQGGGTVEKCCGNCLLKNMVKPLCGNPACECHSAEKKYLGIGDGGLDFDQQLMENQRFAPTKSAEKGHKLANNEGYCYCKHPEVHTNLSTTDTSDGHAIIVKELIENTKRVAFEAGRQQERASLREKIAGMKVKSTMEERSVNRIEYEDGYNQALSDLLDTLKDTH